MSLSSNVLNKILYEVWIILVGDINYFSKSSFILKKKKKRNQPENAKHFGLGVHYSMGAFILLVSKSVCSWAFVPPIGISKAFRNIQDFFSTENLPLQKSSVVSMNYKNIRHVLAMLISGN